MTTRKELIEGIGKRYRASNRKEKQQILEEFTRVTGYHRKHAIRVLKSDVAKRSEKRKRDRIYDNASAPVGQALHSQGNLRPAYRQKDDVALCGSATVPAVTSALSA